MKYTDVVVVLLTMIIALLIVIACSGCALLQPRTTDTIAELPTTGPEAMFQTLKKANWLFTLSVVGVGAGFFAFLNGSNKGLQFMAACFVVISLIIGVTRYSAVIAMISLIGTVCLMAYSVLVRRKAMREVVQGVQDVRGSWLDPVNAPLPNRSIEIRNTITDTLASAQSKTTKALVKKIKAVL